MCVSGKKLVDEEGFERRWEAHGTAWACLVPGEVEFEFGETWPCLREVDLVAQRGVVGADGADIADEASEIQVYTNRDSKAAYKQALVGSSVPATQVRVQASFAEEAYPVVAVVLDACAE